ncbi:SRPBCC family protein [Allokutzneria albata]|uniref:Carbon monoxide dehydrogenase subunit G n=1 Tax=Allokutzneria albata TaxID=211114 RepID=A0A1G9SP51_ALLAB|nr:SRPBCC family protein [Allokutzneria albata]SDM37137.1 Carbon monoxide dehydrogenase subunit G [Allokutzneria albata]
MAPVTGSISIDADPDAVLGILLDVAQYPSWQNGYDKVDIQETDERGRPVLVKWHVSAMGQKASHLLRYSYPAEHAYEFHLDSSEVTTKYDFTCAVTATGSGSEVTASQEIALKWPMPKRLLEKMSRKGIDGLLTALKSRAEGN